MDMGNVIIIVRKQTRLDRMNGHGSWTNYLTN